MYLSCLSGLVLSPDALNNIDSLEIIVRKRLFGFIEILNISDNLIIKCIKNSWILKFDILKYMELFFYNYTQCFNVMHFFLTNVSVYTILSPSFTFLSMNLIPEIKYMYLGIIISYIVCYNNLLTSSIIIQYSHCRLTSGIIGKYISGINNSRSLWT